MSHTNHYTNGLIKNNNIITDIIELNESDNNKIQILLKKKKVVQI